MTSPHIAGGHYAKKQLFSPSALIAWSHRRRFEIGIRLALAARPRRLLDLGCGDGTFLALLMAREHAPREAVGAEVAGSLVDECRRRLRSVPRVRFVRTDELDAPEHRGAYDCVTCMEVLEHVVDVPHELERLATYLAAGGVLIASVPVETGPPLLLKQTARRIAGWRGIGDYPGMAPYRWRDLARGVFAGSRPHMPRPLHRTPDGREFHDHKGFNWRVVRREIARRFTLEAVHTSPITWLPPLCASQVWFVARKP